MIQTNISNQLIGETHEWGLAAFGSTHALRPGGKLQAGGCCILNRRRRRIGISSLTGVGVVSGGERTYDTKASICQFYELCQ